MTRYIDYIFRVWRQHFALLCLYVLLLALPCCLKYTDSGDTHFAIVRFTTGLGSALCMAAVLTLCAVRRYVACVISFVLWLMCFNEFFLFMNFHTRMSARVIASVLQTNPDEAGDFVDAYVMRLPVLKAFMGSVSPFAFYAAMRLAWPSICRYVGRWPWRVVSKAVFALLLLCSSILVYIGLFTTICYEQISLPTVSQLVFSFRNIQDNRKYMRHLEAAVAGTDGALTIPAEEAPAIVYVIGESMNKHHLPLYGYPLQTCPRLSEEKEKGNLMVFTQATTPYPATELVMDMVMSPYMEGDSLPWHRQPLMPAIFRHAGYKVSYHDNQTSRVQADAKWDSKFMWYFNSSKIERACFNYRNPMLHPYDLPFVREQLRHACFESPSLAIFHLKGQHLPAAHRYPSDYRAVFTSGDYAYRRDLDAEQRQTVACYDNAVRYGDEVISLLIDAVAGKDAILIFHSDHGEEVHDYRDQYGRTMEEPTPGIRRNIFEVPFVIYTTPEFRTRHAELYEELRGIASRPFSLSQMTPLLLRIASIRTRFADN